MNNGNHPCYFLVDSNVLPDIFKKVVEAKKLLAQGKVKNLSEAARVMGIPAAPIINIRTRSMSMTEESLEKWSHCPSPLGRTEGFLNY